MGIQPSATSPQSYFKREQWQEMYFDYGARVIVNKRIPNYEVQQNSLIISHGREMQLAQELQRVRRNDSHLVNILHCQVFKESNLHPSGVVISEVYNQRIPIRLSHLKNIPFPDVLHLYSQAILGFEKLMKYFGYFIVNEDCIGINTQYIVKIWHNPNFASVKIFSTAFSEEEMIRSILVTIERCIDVATMPILEPNFRCYIYKDYRELNFEILKRKLYEYAKEFNKGKIPMYLTFIELDGGALKIRGKSIQYQNRKHININTNYGNSFEQQKILNIPQIIQIKQKPHIIFNHNMTQINPIINVPTNMTNKVRFINQVSQPISNSRPISNFLSGQVYFLPTPVRQHLKSQLNSSQTSTSRFLQSNIFHNKIKNPNKKPQSVRLESQHVCRRQSQAYSNNQILIGLASTQRPISQYTTPVVSCTTSQFPQILICNSLNPSFIQRKVDQNRVIRHQFKPATIKQTIQGINKNVATKKVTFNLISTNGNRQQANQNENINHQHQINLQSPYFNNKKEKKQQNQGQQLSSPKPKYKSLKLDLTSSQRKKWFMTEQLQIEQDGVQINKNQQQMAPKSPPVELNIENDQFSPINPLTRQNTERFFPDVRQAQSVNTSARFYCGNLSNDDQSQVIQLSSPLDYRLGNKERLNFKQLILREEFRRGRSQTTSKIFDEKDTVLHLQMLQNMQMDSIQQQKKSHSARKHKSKGSKQFRGDVARLGFDISIDQNNEKGMFKRNESPSFMENYNEQNLEKVLYKQFSPPKQISQEKKNCLFNQCFQSTENTKIPSSSMSTKPSLIQPGSNESDQPYKFEWDPQILADMQQKLSYKLQTL